MLGTQVSKNGGIIVRGIDDRFKSVRVRSGFAWFATVLMVLVAFQIVASSSVGQIRPADEDAYGFYPSSVSEDSPKEGPDGTIISPFYDPAPGGELNAYGGAPYSVFSETANAIAHPLLERDNSSLSVQTHSGRYLVDEKRPESLLLLDDNGTALVRESYFIVAAPEIDTMPFNGTILEASSGLVLVQYDLMSTDDSHRLVATMQVAVDFTDLVKPKITAKVVMTRIYNWNVVWVVFVRDYSNSVVSETKMNQSEVFAPTPPSSSTLAVEVVDSSMNRVLVDWSDAAEGTYSVKLRQTLANESLPALQIAFGCGKGEIDPALVVPQTGGSTPTEYACQRKVFWYGGYYWAFYDRGDKICYARSADGSQWSSGFEVPGGTAVIAGTGFDVACRDNTVALCWKSTISYVSYLWFIRGTILGNSIVWESVQQIASNIQDPQSTPSISIGTDKSYWVATFHHRVQDDEWFYVYRSLDGEVFLQSYVGQTFNGGIQNCYVLMPIFNGDMVLLEVPFNDGSSADTYVRTRYYASVAGGWAAPSDHPVGIFAGSKKEKFSAVASTDGRVHMAYMENSGSHRLRYAVIDSDGYSSWYDITSSAISGYPSICLDGNSDLHIFYFTSESNKPVIRHTQKVGATDGDWSTPDVFYSYPSSASVKGLTAWAMPVANHALVWTEGDMAVKFGCIPLPYGTPGSQAEPWNREGISPYGTYFSTHGDYISPGSGLLSLRETDVSVASRGGLSLDVSRLYVQPRYFRLSNGTPYMPALYPYCDIGPGWSLDLPWMDCNFVGVPGGQRFIIMWGNTGNPNVFENHDGTHFTLRRVSQSTPHGSLFFYELVMGSGARYVFDYWDLKLVEISTLTGYEIDSSTYSDSNNVLMVYYDYIYNRISSMRDDLGRQITFTYNASGNLWELTRADGTFVTFGYTTYGAEEYLTSVKDSCGRITRYHWDLLGSSPYNLLITSVTYPTGGVTQYQYNSTPLPVPSPGTEVRSWYVTSAMVKMSPAGPLVSQTDFDYRVVCGRVRFCRHIDKNETQAIQGYTEFIFESTLKYTTETKKNMTGIQIARTDTWYDKMGQPVRSDIYRGASVSVNYSEYTNYDDWGNVIFTRDALGHESYQSYANTKTENSFQGGSVLTRTNPGKIFYDSFDDWNISDWDKSLSSGNSATLNGLEDPPNAPAVNITRTSSGYAQVSHSFEAQTGTFVIQTKFMKNNLGRAYILGLSNGIHRIYLWAEDYFTWYEGSGFGHEIEAAPCAPKVWYDVGFYVYTNSSYDVYINGSKVAWAMMCGDSGAIDTIRFQAMYDSSVSTSVLVDEVRVYKDYSISLTEGSYVSYVAELYDARGTLLDRGRDSGGVYDLTMPPMCSSFPPGYIRVAKLGYSDFEGPMMDIWGGDSYTFSSGMLKSPLSKIATGYAANYASYYDYRLYADEKDFLGDTLPNNDLTWVQDRGYAVLGNWYHESAFRFGTHWHGFQNCSMSAASTSWLVQYIWLTEGKLPQEVALQIKVNGVWWRAYWGGSSSIIELGGSYDAAIERTKRMGDVPSATGKWLQLTVRESDLGITQSQIVSGVIYALYGGTARWDFTVECIGQNGGIYVDGLAQGLTVDLCLDDDTHISGVAGTSPPVILNLESIGVTVFPVSGYFSILQNTTLLYRSPWFSEIWNLDKFSYSTPEFYVNEVKRLIHDRPIGSFQYQDYAKSQTKIHESYWRYDVDGNPIQTKSGLKSGGWAFAQAGYDRHGNQLWATDQTGRASFTEYTTEDLNTYPESVRQGWRVDTFDTDNTWTSSSDRTWMGATYSSTRCSSSDRSIKASFAGAEADSQDYGTATSWKEYGNSANPVQEISVNMYLESWYHDGGSPTEIMNTGIRMRLYNSGGANYANYTYWLACWSGMSNNTTAPDQYTKIVYGICDLSNGSWKNVVLYPSTDWPSIVWGGCSKVRFELYVTTYWAYHDYLTIYYDDFVYNDFAKSSRTTFSYDRFTGNLLASTNPLGYTTSQQYDAVGRVIRANNSDGSYRTATYSDTNNNVTEFDELGHKTVTYFDKIGRTIKVERWGSGSGAYSSVTYEYNWQDQVSSYTDEIGHLTRYTYDYLGRPTKTTYPDLSYSTVAYDDVAGMATSCSFTSGHILTHKSVMKRDWLGRLNATWEYTTPTASNVTLMTYDAVGNLLTVRDAKAQVTRMYYDLQSRLYLTKYPDLLFEEATYDTAGRTLSKRDREGNSTTSSYDSAGNLVKVTSPGMTISRQYDVAGQLTVVWNNSVGTNQGAVWYNHNGRGWVTTQQDLIDGTWYSTNYGYDLKGRLTSVWSLPGLQCDYGYDSYDRVITVKKHSDQSLLMTATYNKDDTVSTETTGDGTKVTSYAYNNRDRVSNMVMRLSGTIKLVLQYQYDDVGNVKQLVANTSANANQAKTEVYTYDWLDRIKTASGGSLPAGLTYDYDAAGNAVKFAGKTLTFGSYNKLSGDGTWTYTYDGNGNEAWKTKSNEKWSYQFNSLDQLTKVVKWTKSGSTWTATTQGEYWYNPNGMMVKSLQGGTTTYYVYRGHDPLMEKTGSTSTYYAYVNGRMFAKLVGGTTYYYIRDALGSTRQVWQSGQTSTTFSVATYKPYGTPVNPSSPPEKFQYAGEMIVSAAGTSPGLYYIGARWMDPELGRWLSLDPELGKLSMPQTLNRYVCCGNNPLSFVDPWGTHMMNLGAVQPHPGATMTQEDLDQEMWIISMIPGAGWVIGGAYFIYRDYQKKDWGMLAFDTACMIPFGSVLKYGKFAKFLRYFGHADDAERAIGTGERVIRNVDEADNALRGAPEFFRAMDTGSELHHWAPAEHSWYFGAKGIDIDEYTERIYRDVHKVFHGRELGQPSGSHLNLNKDWDKWILRNPGASRLQVLDQIGAFRQAYISHFEL